MTARQRTRTFYGGEALHVEGLNQTIKGLRDVDKNLSNVVAKANKRLTERTILPAAQAKWRAQNIKPSVAAQVIKASGTTRGAAIRLRSSSVGKFPFAAGVEFGAKVHTVFGKRTMPQTAMKRRVFRPWRGNRFTGDPRRSTGYVVQDAIKEKIGLFEQQWVGAVEGAIAEAIRNGI